MVIRLEEVPRQTLWWGRIVDLISRGSSGVSPQVPETASADAAIHPARQTSYTAIAGEPAQRIASIQRGAVVIPNGQKLTGVSADSRGVFDAERNLIEGRPYHAMCAGPHSDGREVWVAAGGDTPEVAKVAEDAVRERGVRTVQCTVTHPVQQPAPRS